MLVAAHQGRLDTPDKTGVSGRAALCGLLEREALPAAQRARLEAELDGLPFPEPMAYLWDRFETLNGMRTVTEHGPVGFTPEMLRAADQLFGWALSPMEVEALRRLDVAYRHPEPFLKEAD
jgi:hypothetical protein